MKIEQLQTPCYVIDEKKMRENLEILKKVQEDTGCKVLLAQKAFSGFALYPMIGKYLAGTTASGLFEARLGHEEMGKENHVFPLLTVQKIWRNWTGSVTILSLILQHS